jgi:ethanolamine-phosphate phospho-lyase
MSSTKHEIDRILSARSRHLGRNLSVSYNSSVSGPLLITRGRAQYLYDADGTKYLDCVNNVVCKLCHNNV